jgi:hypothetical protein
MARGFMDTCLHEKEKAKAVEKVGGAHPRPYKYHSTSGNQNTHHILKIPLAKLLFLV